MIYTLIAITVISVQSPGVMVTTTQVSEQQACVSTMASMVEGAGAIYRANVHGAHGDVKTQEVGGWTLLRSGLGREIARFKCV
jgi:hypothetical protein